MDDVATDAGYNSAVNIENPANVLDTRARQNVTRDIPTTLENSASLLTFLALIWALCFYAFTFSSSFINASQLALVLVKTLCLSVMIAKSPSALWEFVDVSVAMGIISLGQGEKVPSDRKGKRNTESVIGRSLMNFVEVLS